MRRRGGAQVRVRASCEQPINASRAARKGCVVQRRQARRIAHIHPRRKERRLMVPVQRDIALVVLRMHIRAGGDQQT